MFPVRLQVVHPQMTTTSEFYVEPADLAGCVAAILGETTGF